MRVLIITAWDPKSGVLSFYRSLVGHLRPRGVHFSAFAFDGWGEDTWWTFCDELIDGRRRTLAEILATGKYDLLHCIASAYSPPYDVEKWVRRARFRGPVVLMSQMAQRELNGQTHASAYVAPAPDSAAVLEADASGPVRIIANGYDETVFHPVESEAPSRPVLAWVGRSWDPQKGIDLFLDALEALPEYDGAIVDETADPETIAERLARLEPRVRHLPRLPPQELAEVYRSAAGSGGAYLCTSRYEGFPIAPLEAMGCGCPIVAPDVPGLTHLVDGGNAIVYDRSGGTAAVSRALDRLRDPQVRAAVVEGGFRDTEDRWTSHATADAYYALYREVLGATPTPTSAQRLLDAVARLLWRGALAVRPLWHAIRRR